MSDAAPAATPATEATPTPAADAASAGNPAVTAAPDALLGGKPAATTTTEPAKPAEPAAPAVPEKYEFAAPEVGGKPVSIAPADLTAFEATARELGLTQAQFQGVTAAGAAKIAALAAAPVNAWHDLQRTWQSEIKADAEIGGDKLGPALAEAAIALDHPLLGGAALRQALETTGAGNHPAIVKAFVQIGRMMADPSRIVTGSPASPAKSQEQRARDFYNNPKLYPQE